MTVRPIVIGLVIFYANAYSQAQMNDYYVSISGDTLQGTCIRNSMSPKRVLFTTNFGTRIDLTPDSTTCVVCGKTKLIGANVEIEVSPYIVDEMDTFYTLNLERRNVFLIESKTGIKQLYWFVDKYKRDQIYIRENNQFVLLRFKRYKWYPNINEIFLLENTEFRSQLSTYLANCENVNSQLQHTQYNINSIAKLFDYFYKCFPTKTK